MKLESFDDVQKSMKSNPDRNFHLLMGNGFSMAYDPTIFSYNALHEFITKLDDDLISKLLGVIKTKNFEIIMQQLETFAGLIEAFGSDKSLKSKVEKASKKLKQSLLDAIKALHPEHVFTIPQEKSDACATFLKVFLDSQGHIYTTNYDLLLYWVLMRNGIMKSVDGFGRERENPDEDVPPEEFEYSELRWGKHKEEQNIFYVHGALPLFDTGVEIVKEEYDSQHYLLANINERLDQGDYPIFVTAGNGREKLTHIMHNRYLSHCYDCLSNITGSLVTFGFNFGEYDEHIIHAINAAAKHGKKSFPKLLSIYIGVYSDADHKHIEKIAEQFKCKVHIFDSKTASVWG
jgi:cellobiose-specific phosphotransferase system component IIA